MKTFLKKYQVIIFFALTFIISWYPWYTGGHGFKAAGPSYAGLIVVALVGGWKGIVEMLRRLIRWRASIGVWAVALLGPVAITLVAVGLHVLTGGDAPSFTFWKAKWYDPLLFMLLLISPFGGPGGEEPFGWRGYAQPKLQKKWGQWGPLVTSLIIGTAWGVWHLPEFFNPASSQYAIGIGFFVPLIVMEIAHSIPITWLYNKTGGSILLSGILFHLMFDMSSTLLLDATLVGITTGEVIPPIDSRLLTTQAVVMVAAALIFVIATKGRLGYSVEDERTNHH